ncbi:hypothetical protein D3C76_1083770 [compost metagenome]
MTDLNHDQKDEIVIILTTGTGSGVHIQELHILSKEDLSELTFENPLAYVNKHIESNVEISGEEVKVQVKWDQESIEKLYNKADAGAWFDAASFGQIIEYELVGNQLTAILPGNVSPGEFAISATLHYDTDLKIDTLTVSEN